MVGQKDRSRLEHCRHFISSAPAQTIRIISVARIIKSQNSSGITVYKFISLPCE